MNKITTVFLLSFMLTACKAPNTPEALGEHNLSKGRCVDIPMCDAQGQCQAIRDESVQYVCEMVGGKFEPREFKKTAWFF